MKLLPSAPLQSTFLNILTNFRHKILPVCQKVESKNILEKEFCKSFYNLNVFFMANLIFSVIIIHVQVCKRWYKQPQKKKIGSINLLNTLLVLTPTVLHHFTAPPNEKTSQRPDIAHRILSKNALAN